MSKLRPECRDASPDSFSPKNGTAYLMIFNAVKQQDGLIAGRLHNHKGESCAIGSYFDVNKGCSISTPILEEVAAVNDSMPDKTPRQRKQAVMRWLRWKMSQFGLKP